MAQPIRMCLTLHKADVTEPDSLQPHQHMSVIFCEACPVIWTRSGICAPRAVRVGPWGTLWEYGYLRAAVVGVVKGSRLTSQSFPGPPQVTERSHKGTRRGPSLAAGAAFCGFRLRTVDVEPQPSGMWFRSPQACGCAGCPEVEGSAQSALLPRH